MGSEYKKGIQSTMTGEVQGRHMRAGYIVSVISSQEVGLGCTSSNLSLRDQLPPARFHLLEVPQSSKTMPPAGYQVFETGEPVEDHNGKEHRVLTTWSS